MCKRKQKQSKETLMLKIFSIRQSYEQLVRKRGRVLNSAVQCCNNTSNKILNVGSCTKLKSDGDTNIIDTLSY